MKAKNNLITCVLSFCVAALLFTAIPAIGQVGEYDPWLDTNDDGYIGIDDLFTMAEHFGAEGEPINKTELLLQLQDRLEELSTIVTEQQTMIDDLNASVIVLDTAKLGAPDYDSGWRSISVGSMLTLSHFLGTTNVIVYVMGRDSVGNIHHNHYGGETWDNRGAYWWTDSNFITLYRMTTDTQWINIRAMIWRIPSP